MKKKLCTLLITLTLTCSLLIGCGNSDTVDTAPASSESASETAAVDTSESSDETATTDSQESVDKTTTSDTPESTDESTTEASESATETSTTDAQESPEDNTDTTAEENIDDSTEKKTVETESPEEAPILTPEPIPEPVAVYTYTDMVQTMYAKSTVNVRDLPDTSGNKLGSLAPSQEVAVTGTCNETGWYKIDYNGSIAFVSNEYLVAEKPVAPAKTTSPGGMSRNIADYRQISSLSELTPSAGWTADFAGFCATYKSIPKVAYTYNGVTILLYDYTWNDDYGDWCVFYDFSRQHTTSPWSRNYFSSVHSIIDAGGYETYSFNLDGSKFYTWHPISDYQVY